MSKKKKNEDQWKIVEKRFRLNSTQMAMAKELGMNPRKFGGYAANKAEPWKKPIGQFIEECYAKRFNRKKPK